MVYNNIKKITVVARAYKTRYSSEQPFIEQLVSAIIDKGVFCDVIVPQSITRSIVRKRKLPPEIYRAKTNSDKEYNIYCPRYISISYLDGFFAKFMIKINLFLYKKAVFRAVKKYGLSQDLFYGHFFQPAGFVCADLSKKYNKPYFVACGESMLKDIDILGVKWVSDKLRNIAGVVTVSTYNKNRIVERGLLDERKIKVFLNSVNKNIFYKRNKNEAREKLGVDKDSFIVCFVGRREHRKGTLRLSAALKRLKDVKSFFIGEGEEVPDCEGVLYCRPLPHERIAWYLSASDVFVLPTLAEGCSNAVIEAMACGLPVISSDLDFNHDILNAENSILVDPNDITQISGAIAKLKESPELRDKMSRAALKTAAGLDINARAENILDFINSNI